MGYYEFISMRITFIMSNKVKVFRKIPKKEVNIKKMNNNGVYHYYPKYHYYPTLNTEEYVFINDYNERITLSPFREYYNGRIVITGSFKNAGYMEEFIDDVTDWIKSFAEGFSIIINHYNEDEPIGGNTIKITNYTEEGEPEIKVLSINERYWEYDFYNKPEETKRYKRTHNFETQ